MQPSLFRCLVFLLLFTSISAFAQEALPKDYLSPEFHRGRREAARAKMPVNSVMVVFAAPMRTFSNDVEYNYHQNPDLYYFTGYKEPHAVLFIFSEYQVEQNGKKYNELFFVQKKDALAEHWDGRRLGKEGVQQKLGFKNVYHGEELASASIDFSKFNYIIFDYLPEDVKRSNEPGALFNLLKIFRKKAVIPEGMDPQADELARTAKGYLNVSNLSQVQEYIRNQVKLNPSFAKNTSLNQILELKDEKEIQAFRNNENNNRYNTELFYEITSALREIKTKEELGLIRKAVEISCRGQNEVMKAVRPDMSELEIQGLHEYIHKKYGAEGVGYGSIIGAGENGCILHYTENTKTKVGRDLILMDVGAEYHGYTADVTRTIPADGKFNTEESAIYQLVYDAQEAAFKTLKDGSTWQKASDAAREVIAEGLIKLGIIRNKDEVGRYFTHGLGHHIGLDVHDKGRYDTLKKNMVITIEPGIYISSNSDCDKKWWGISVRIEDDALITQEGYELLSVFSPRSIEAIEKMIAEKSLLEDFKLPPLRTEEKKKDF